MLQNDFLVKGQAALILSTLAGLSTTVGGLLAIVKKPNEATLALLLGLAIGVMVTVSAVELVVKNALENNTFAVLGSAMLGALVFYIIEPFIPTFEPTPTPHKAAETTAAGRQQETGKRLEKRGKKKTNGDSSPAPATPQQKPAAVQPVQRTDTVLPGQLIRLGLLMAFTMTLHNLPEGFAVAFSAFTKLGPIMTLAIAVHNIPEGIIVAAPIYAATGSRWKALGLAAASGLSEPLGAFLGLMMLQPETVEHYVHYLLAAVGGTMLAVCVLELWPEGRKCRSDLRLAQGIALGCIAMGWTLYVGG